MHREEPRRKQNGELINLLQQGEWSSLVLLVGEDENLRLISYGYHVDRFPFNQNGLKLWNPFTGEVLSEIGWNLRTI